jgi:hypothetical protein
MSTQTEPELAGLKMMRNREEVIKDDRKESVKNYRGFVAGVFSGISKLSGQYTLYFLWPTSSSRD